MDVFGFFGKYPVDFAEYYTCRFQYKVVVGIAFGKSKIYLFIFYHNTSFRAGVFVFVFVFVVLCFSRDALIQRRVRVRTTKNNKNGFATVAFHFE